jgi:hypothetical protein
MNFDRKLWPVTLSVFPGDTLRILQSPLLDQEFVHFIVLDGDNKRRRSRRETWGLWYLSEALMISERYKNLQSLQQNK